MGGTRGAGGSAQIYKEVRCQEKTDLTDLNVRLRNYVNLQQKKQGEYERMISALGTVEKQFEDQMANKDFDLRRMHQTQQSHRLVQRGLIADQENSAKSQRLRCDELYAKTRNVNSDIAVLEAKQREINAEHDATRATLDNTKSALGQTSDRLKSETIKVSELNAQLGSAKLKHAHMLQEQSKVDVTLKDTQEKLTRFIDETDGQISQLRNELIQRGEAEKRIEEELRHEYQTKLEEFINSRLTAHQAEKEEWMKIFRDEHARKISAYRNANEDYESQIVKLRDDRGLLGSKCDDLDVKIDNIKRDIAKFTAERDRFAAMVGENNDKIGQLRQVLRKKTDEFDEMLKFKENLEREIQEYWAILGGEERRLGFRQPRA